MTEIVNPHGRIVNVPWDKVDTYLRSGYRALSEVLNPTGYRDDLSSVKAGEKVCIYRSYGGLGDVVIQSHILNEIVKQYPHIDLTYAIPTIYHDLFAGLDSKLTIIDSTTVMRDEVKSRREDVFNLNKEYALFFDISNPCKKFENILRRNLFESVNYMSRFDMWADYIGIKLPSKTKTIIKHGTNVSYKGGGKRVGIGFKSAHFHKDYPQLIQIYYWLYERGYEPILIDENNIEGLRFLNAKNTSDLFTKMASLDYVISVDTSIFHIACSLGIRTLGVFNINQGEAYIKYYGDHANYIQACPKKRPCLSVEFGTCGFQEGQSCYPHNAVNFIIPKLKQLGWVNDEVIARPVEDRVDIIENAETPPKVLIILPTFNRKRTLEFTLPIMRKNASEHTIWIFDDFSDDFDDEWLAQFADKVTVNDYNQHISKGWWQKMMKIIEPYVDEFDYIYKTDSDAICDPDFINRAVAISKANGNRPAGVYNSKNHTQYTVDEPCNGNAFSRTNCPGISMLIPVPLWKTIEPYEARPKSAFDTELAKRLPPFVISRRSYVEHLGAGGMHIADDAWDQETAICPTEYLKLKRREFLQSIGVKCK